MESVSYETLNNNLSGPINTVQEQINTAVLCNKFNVAIIFVSIVIGIEMFLLLLICIKLNLKPISTRNLLARLNN